MVDIIISLSLRPAAGDSSSIVLLLSSGSFCIIFNRLSSIGSVVGVRVAKFNFLPSLIKFYCLSLIKMTQNNSRDFIDVLWGKLFGV